MDWTIVVFIFIIGAAAFLLSKRKQGDARNSNDTAHPADTSHRDRSHDSDNYDSDSGGGDSD